MDAFWTVQWRLRSKAGLARRNPCGRCGWRLRSKGRLCQNGQYSQRVLGVLQIWIGFQNPNPISQDFKIHHIRDFNRRLRFQNSPNPNPSNSIPIPQNERALSFKDCETIMLFPLYCIWEFYLYHRHFHIFSDLLTKIKIWKRKTNLNVKRDERL